MYDAITDRDILGVVIMKSAQVGYTQLLKNTIGYYIDQDPSPMIFLMPSQSMAESFSKERLDPMFRDTPALRNKIKSSRDRDSGNTRLNKKFPGGTLTLASASSATDIASRPKRIVIGDELDKFLADVKGEGDPWNLALARQKTFWNKKWIVGSTPSRANESRIYDAFIQSDQRYYFIACPHCQEKQTLKFEQMKWDDGDCAEAYYVCEHNGCVITDHEKNLAVSEGEWIATQKFNGVAGFHISELYSPFSSFEKIANSYETNKDTPQKLQTFFNSVLGLPFEEASEGVSSDDFKGLVDDYERRVVPEKVGILTAFVDIQKDRVEFSVIGFARHLEPFVIDHQVIYGSVNDYEFRTTVSDELKSLEFERFDGKTLKLSMIGVDSGYETKSAYDLVRLIGSKAVATKGVGGFSRDFVSRPTYKELTINGKIIKRGVKMHALGVDIAKVWVYDRFTLSNDKVGRAHFPDGMSDDYFEQLSAERLQIQNVRGYKQRRWIKVNDRNEALDCFVGCVAMAFILGADKFSRAKWDSLEGIKPESDFMPKKDNEIVKKNIERSNPWGELGSKSNGM